MSQGGSPGAEGLRGWLAWLRNGEMNFNRFVTAHFSNLESALCLKIMPLRREA
jgi:hypothetical protein